jgi:hypothetical protein
MVPRPWNLDIRQMETRVWCSQMSRPSRCFLHPEEFTFGEYPRKPTIWKAWHQHWNMGDVLWWFRQQYRGTLLVPLLHFMDELLQREYVDKLGNQVHRMSSEKRCSFPRRQWPHSHSWNCSIMVWREWRWISTSCLARAIISFEHHWTTLVTFGH